MVDKITSPITQTDLLGKVNDIIDSVNGGTVVNTTYSNLVSLKSGGNLVKGYFYRITDYVTTTNGTACKGTESGAPTEASRSAGHAFDIIIQATGPSNLASQGQCAIHSGDTYFASQNVGAWQIWYDIENNTSKYEWADTTNGKGVIYRMIDEFNNDIPYDFKNIQFYRDDTSSRYTPVAAHLKASDDYYYTFSKVDTSTGAVTDLTLDASAGSKVNNNIMKSAGGSSGGVQLNNNIFVASGSTINTANNTFAPECYANTFIAPFYNNTFDGILTYSNIMNANVFYNSFGTNFNRNKTSTTQFARNSIYANFFSNNISITSGNFNYNKTLGTFNGCTINTTGTVERNMFMGNALSISITGSGISRNVFGDGAEAITIGSAMVDTYIGSYTYNITINNGITACNIGSQCENLLLTNSLKNIVIAPLTIGSSASNKLSLSGLPTGANYPIYVRLDENGKPVATWNDGINNVGLIKTSLTASSWDSIGATLVTSINSSSTDSQYPSAKCVYDLVGNIETLLSQV